MGGNNDGVRYGNRGDALYGLGVIGAWVYFWQQADGFWMHLWALVEGVFWPAFIVYHALAALL